ncbi:uncharacterized protein MEPE_04036 [Melanopsichium pennsylvanicum]|uniref:CRAL-TRIO domain-containing protein n=2 Tax=Melanopsichium pennsylvanicum TaxID=63383 RepID=A0AAJ4XN75_9BASI|nr:conserved hypothetical protein [Melanopsichium pennsylvanicum 4]SNX85327.1 uncharacterized protein MEPE_04036 [Melanopsichium pennsylvanicum]
MPSVKKLKSKNAQAVQHKHLDLISKYNNHLSAVDSLYKVARIQIIDDVASQLSLNEQGKARISYYLSDTANLFRFYRRARYHHDTALSLLTATILWRMRTDLDLLSLSSLNPLYVTPPSPNPPLFWLNSGFKDYYGRPCGVISLRSVERTAENTLDQLKEYIVACMEIVRRYLADLFSISNSSSTSSANSKTEHTVLQAAIAVDLASSGMANLELELLPFLLDLLKNHVPGIVGAVYILNYGWVHSGMWAVIKRVLPQQALAKIFFPTYQELKEHFDPQNIPQCYGGEMNANIESATNDVLRKYGRPRRVSNAAATAAATAAAAAAPTDPTSPVFGGKMSRTNSYESIYEVFYSADSTPWASRPITPRHSEPSTPRAGLGESSGGAFKMTSSAARKLKHLQMSRSADLSSAAEHAHTGSGRPRSASDPKIVDGRAVGLSVSTSTFVTPSMTPVGPLSPRILRSRNPDRHVRFSGERDRSSSPQTRVGGTSNFTLYLPTQHEEAILPSESEDSDASGKDGELAPQDAPSSGLFNRLRRLSATQFTSSSSSTKTDPSQQEKADETIVYTIPPSTPSSPHLQVPHLDEPPLSLTHTYPHNHVPHRFLSHRTRRSTRDGSVSPYNANNPFFGYPAFTPNSSSAKFSLNRNGTTPQHLHTRRRKRDLLRTLTYLFVLRILALHRKMRYRVSLVAREVGRSLKLDTDANGEHGVGEEDEFWRNLDAKRLSALPENQSKHVGRGAGWNMVKKLTSVIIIVTLLKPEWRRQTMLRVYKTLFIQSHDEGEVNWDEWDRPSSIAAADAISAKPHSFTGFQIRSKLGFKNPQNAASSLTDTAASSGKSGKRSRVNPVAIAGGLISAAGLGYLLYTYLSNSNSNKAGGGGDDDDEGDVTRRRSCTKPGQHSTNRARPSLSLSISPTFQRTPSNIGGLGCLLQAISPLFVVHLILPGSGEQDLSTSIQSLNHALGAIDEFDPRRVLEYTQTEGRFALSRALACDCHTEISMPGSEEIGTFDQLNKIRRTCGLVVFTNFSQSNQDSGGAEQSGGQQVLNQLKELAMQQQGNANNNFGSGVAVAPAGMRAFDLSSDAVGDEQWKWDQLAQNLAELRRGWK